MRAARQRRAGPSTTRSPHPGVYQVAQGRVLEDVTPKWGSRWDGNGLAETQPLSRPTRFFFFVPLSFSLTSHSRSKGGGGRRAEQGGMGDGGVAVNVRGGGAVGGRGGGARGAREERTEKKRRKNLPKGSGPDQCSGPSHARRASPFPVFTPDLLFIRRHQFKRKKQKRQFSNLHPPPLSSSEPPSSNPSITLLAPLHFTLPAAPGPSLSFTGKEGKKRQKTVLINTLSSPPPRRPHPGRVRPDPGPPDPRPVARGPPPGRARA